MPKETSKYKQEYDQMAYVACVDGGFTDKKLGRLFGVTETTVNNWKKDHPSFFESIKKGKDEFNVAVAENSLLKRVKGFSYTETTKEPGKDGKLVTVKTVKKQVAPDTTAIIFFLKNRDTERWRDQKHLEHGGGLKITHEDALAELDE